MKTYVVKSPTIRNALIIGIMVASIAILTVANRSTLGTFIFLGILAICIVFLLIKQKEVQ
jgi:uncharacterized MnhB-related membrane protein